ncbi:uncharacterized protein TNCV_5079431 [Trichonephila clavipes]|nr:uncharacterized protein TNCV_5079431 [Trichonephila clavipes]
MLETGWSAQQVTRQVGLSDLTVRRCCNQWTEETSFTQLTGSGGPRQTSRRENRHIIRNAHVEPPSSLVAVQMQAASSRQALCLTEPLQGAWLKDIWYHGGH